MSGTMKTEELEKINKMFEKVYARAIHDTFGYDRYQAAQDIIDIWDYVRSKLGQPKVERFAQVDLETRRIRKWKK